MDQFWYHKTIHVTEWKGEITKENQKYVLLPRNWPSTNDLQNQSNVKLTTVALLSSLWDITSNLSNNTEGFICG